MKAAIHRLMPTFGQTDFGETKINRLWPTLIDRLWPKFGWPTLAKPTLAKKLVFQSFGLPFQKKKKQNNKMKKKHGRTNTLRGPEGWGAQNFALFFPSPATISLFLCLSGCLLVDFWWCLKAGA